MEPMTEKLWSLGMHGQCIDIVSNLPDAFIGDVGKYKFTYEVKRIDDKCETEAIINLKKTKLRNGTVLKYKIHVEVRNSRDLSFLREITENLCNTFWDQDQMAQINRAYGQTMWKKFV